MCSATWASRANGCWPVLLTNVDKTKRKLLNAVFLAAGVSSQLNSRFARKKFRLCLSVLSSQDFQDVNKYC